MGKGALRPFFKGHSLKKEKEHEKKEVDKMLLHFVTLPISTCFIFCSVYLTGSGSDYIGAGLFFLTRISRIGRIGLADSLASDDKICRR